MDKHPFSSATEPSQIQKNCKTADLANYFNGQLLAATRDHGRAGTMAKVNMLLLSDKVLVVDM